MSETDTSGLMPSAAAYEEAKWSRVLAQQAVAFSAFAAVLVLTRLWTSFTSTKFLRRRHKNQVDTFLALTDIVCSTASMFIFVAQSIIREYQVGITAVEVLLSSFYAVAFVRRLWVKNFDFAIAFTFSTFFDVYAVSVISYQVFSPEPTWLTPTFMRSISVLIRYEEVMKMGFWASYAGEVKQRLGLSILRFACVTFFYACVGFCLEILGDIDLEVDGNGAIVGISERSPNYDTTLLTQLYFVVVTLSTVGYGDITPATTLHKVFAIVMIVSGVAFFSSEVAAIVALKDEIDSGRGKYRRSRFRNAHIIILGGAVTSGSATLQIFLEELLHPSRPNSSLPDVVLMSEEAPGTGLRRVLTSALGQAHVKFIRGSPMDQADLARADAANADMAFVLGNLSVRDHLTEAEDEDTILRASLLQRQLPGLPVRLLLLRSWAKEMARTAGINPLSCLTSGVLNHCRTALAVRCPGLPVLLTTMYSKLAGDWSQLPNSMMPWVREYFTSMRHDVYGAQIGAAFDGMPFLEAAAKIYEEHDVNLLAVQSAPENGGRLCPAGMIGGHLHVLSEGDVVMCLGQDVKRVLRAVGSSSKHPEAWRARFHAVRTAAARMGIRREVFVAAPGGASTHGGASVRGGNVFGGLKSVPSARLAASSELNKATEFGKTMESGAHKPTHQRANSGELAFGSVEGLSRIARLSKVESGDGDLTGSGDFDTSFHNGVAPRSPSQSYAKRRVSVPAGMGLSTEGGEGAVLEPAQVGLEETGSASSRLKQAASSSLKWMDTIDAQTPAGTSDTREAASGSQRFTEHAPQATWRRGDALGMRHELRELASSADNRRRLVPSALAGNRLSASTRNLSELRAKLATKVEVQDLAKAVRKQRAEGLAELGFTPWHTISRICKTGNHIIVIVDGHLDQPRWNELEVLLHRLRGNDGSNIRPIIVLSKSPPAVQDLILWRSIEVYVTEGCVSDVQTAQALAFDNAANIVLLADACASDNPLLMDRRVLLATSVLEREDELTPDHMLPKVILEFHHPKSVWHVQEARGFGSLESGLRKHMCRAEKGNERAGKLSTAGGGAGGSSENLHAMKSVAASKKRHADARRRFSTDNASTSLSYAMGTMDGLRDVTVERRFTRSASSDPRRNDLSDADLFQRKESHKKDRGRRASLDRGWGSMAIGARGDGDDTASFDNARAKTPLGLALQKSRGKSFFAKFVRGCLKFVGVLDRDGRERNRKNMYSAAYRDSFQNQSRLSWVEHPESHTQYSRGNVMFRTEVSRVMATVFYTPGLMELVDSLTRDAHSGEDIGHHPRIWSVPLPTELKGKRMGHAFQFFAKNEALVVGVYRNVKGGKARKKVAQRKIRRGSVDTPFGCDECDESVHGGDEFASASGDGFANERRSRNSSGGTLNTGNSDSPENSTAGGGSKSPTSSEGEHGSDFDSEDEDVLDGRRRADPEHDYVLTAPPHTVKLNSADRLYVIATTDWAWINVPEMVELRKTSAVICLQRQFRARKDRRQEMARDEKLAEFPGRAGPEETPLSEITFRKRRMSQGSASLADLIDSPQRTASPSPLRY